MHSRGTTKCVRCDQARHYCSSLKRRCHAGPTQPCRCYNARFMDQHHRQHSSGLDRQKGPVDEPFLLMRTVAPTCVQVVVHTLEVSIARTPRNAAAISADRDTGCSAA